MANVDDPTFILLTITGVMVGGISQDERDRQGTEVYKLERLVNLQILPYVLSKGGGCPARLYQAAVYTIVHYLAFVCRRATRVLPVIHYPTLANVCRHDAGPVRLALAPNASSAPLLVIILCYRRLFWLEH